MEMHGSQDPDLYRVRWGHRCRAPVSVRLMAWGTLTVNLVGSLLLGALMGAAAHNEVISKEMVMFLGIGILGAFTTLSTYSFETIELWRQGETTRSLLYAGTTAVIGPLLALLGWLGAERFIA